MILDQWGFPKIPGASDLADSAVYCSMLAIFGDAAPDMRKFVNRGMIYRHPFDSTSGANNPLSTTRDQSVPVMAALAVQGHIFTAREVLAETVSRGWRSQSVEHNVPGSKKQWPDGPDIIWPGQQAHYLRCADLPDIKNKNAAEIITTKEVAMPTKLQNWWFKKDITISGRFWPLNEQNQLQSMVYIAGQEAVELYKKSNPQWKIATMDYWSTGHGSWRGAHELPEMIISVLDKNDPIKLP